MITVYSKALHSSIEIDRNIGHIKGHQPGATVIFIGGIHGNEPSGVFAIHQVLKTLQTKKHKIKGTIYGLAGNLAALKKGIRYQNEDLNRIWNEPRIEKSTTDRNKTATMETRELSELYKSITVILEKESGPFYFIDLHTTSSATQPFITVNDNLLNRKFTQQYPVPLLLGIEEYLEGTCLNYINGLGYVAFGFESGQHDAPESIQNHIAFIYLSLVFTGNLPKAEIEFNEYFKNLNGITENLAAYYEIVFHHKIEKNEAFEMLPGFKNFDPVRKGRPVAKSDENLVNVPNNGNIFMPLYQTQGTDGFFIIKRVHSIFLRLSSILRKLHVDYLLPFLPGISWESEKRDALTVDLKTTRFFAKKFFHLLGYRNRQVGATRMTVRNREAHSRKKAYRKTTWY